MTRKPFDAELVRRKRTGELAQLDAGKESLASEWGRIASNPVVPVRKPPVGRTHAVVRLAPETGEAIRDRLPGEHGRADSRRHDASAASTNLLTFRDRPADSQRAARP